MSISTRSNGRFSTLNGGSVGRGHRQPLKLAAPVSASRLFTDIVLHQQHGSGPRPESRSWWRAGRAGGSRGPADSVSSCLGKPAVQLSIREAPGPAPRAAVSRSVPACGLRKRLTCPGLAAMPSRCRSPNCSHVVPAGLRGRGRHAAPQQQSSTQVVNLMALLTRWSTAAAGGHRPTRGHQIRACAAFFRGPPASLCQPRIP
jgi:hypothetical protein